MITIFNMLDDIFKKTLDLFLTIAYCRYHETYHTVLQQSVLISKLITIVNYINTYNIIIIKYLLYSIFDGFGKKNYSTNRTTNIKTNVHSCIIIISVLYQCMSMNNTSHFYFRYHIFNFIFLSNNLTILFF